MSTEHQAFTEWGERDMTEAEDAEYQAALDAGKAIRMTDLALRLLLYRAFQVGLSAART